MKMKNRHCVNFVHSVIVGTVLCVQSNAAISEAIKVNHMGYTADNGKQAYVSWRSALADQAPYNAIDSGTAFYLMDSSNTVLYQGALSGPQYDADSDDVVCSADFSSFTNSVSDVHIYVVGLGDSLSFDINSQPYKDALILAMRGYFFQRCGHTFEEEHAGIWARDACHTDDGYYYDVGDYFPAEGSGFKDCCGGWHDAGDYGKKMIVAGLTVDTLLQLCDLFPEEISMLALNLPESGNGVPDILNEIRYELEWMFSMQEPDGGVHHELIPLEFQYEHPLVNSATRYLWQKSTSATAALAANMAQAARVYQAHDAVFAQRCMDAAKLAWGFLEVNPEPVGSGMVGPSPLAYERANDPGWRFLAAAQLYSTTGDQKYQQYIQNNSLGNLANPSWRNPSTLAVSVYVLATHPNADRALQTSLGIKLNDLADEIYNRILAHPYQISLTRYRWGSNSSIMLDSMLLLQAYVIGGTEKFLEAAEHGAHYILGRNALGVSFLSGSSADSSQHIHNSWQDHSGVAGDPVIPGLIGGGPNSNINSWDNTAKSYLALNTPPARCYVDQPHSYSTNENCLNYSSPFVFVTGFLHFLNAANVAPVWTYNSLNMADAQEGVAYDMDQLERD